jgi:hypothetical protein
MSDIDDPAYLPIPYRSDDIDVYRVRDSGLVLTVTRWTHDGKDEEHFSAETADDLAPHCVAYLVANAIESADWELAIAVYGDEQIPAGFIDRVRAAAEIEISRQRQDQRTADEARAKAKEDRDRAEYERLRARFGP